MDDSRYRLVNLKSLNMLNVLSAVRSLMKLQSVYIDNNVFQLHYKVTVIILIIFSLLITSHQYFGAPMDCHFPAYSHGSLNNYCAVQATFSLQRSFSGAVEKDISHTEVSESTEEGDRKFYNYYQWVFLALFVQATFFYAPRYTWKAWEGGTMKMLTNELISPVLTKDAIERKAEILLNYLCMHLHSHNSYAYKYFICELWNCVNVMGQIYFINTFFGGGFKFYGRYIKYLTQGTDENVANPIEWMFPTITKCAFTRYGGSGSLEKLDGICVLTQNAFNEKIFIFMWFWFHILAIVSLLAIIYRVAILSPSIRLSVFRTSSSTSCAKHIEIVHKQLWIGDWFLLQLLQQNLNPMAYKELICRFAQLYNAVGCEPRVWYV